MVFEKKNKLGGKTRILSTIEIESIKYIIDNDGGYNKIYKTLGISKSVLANNNIYTNNKANKKLEKNKVIRIAKKEIVCWADGSTLSYMSSNEANKHSKTFYIMVDGVKKLFKIYSIKTDDKKVCAVIVCEKTAGEKKEHWGLLLNEAHKLKILKDCKNISIDSQVRFDDFKELFPNTIVVNQEKNTISPYQSEIEGVFGNLYYYLRKWIADIPYTVVDERRIYQISEIEVVNKFNELKELALYNRIPKNILSKILLKENNEDNKMITIKV